MTKEEIINKVCNWQRKDDISFLSVECAYKGMEIYAKQSQIDIMNWANEQIITSKQDEEQMNNMITYLQTQLQKLKDGK